MIIVGLTGSISMGKSTAAKMLADLGCSVQDADLVVRGLLAKGGAAVHIINENFPGTVKNGAVDRQILGALVFGNKPALKKLEDILHPLVGQAQNDFLYKSAEKGVNIAVLEVPLLFETNGHKKCDKNILMTAPLDIQKSRALKRQGMSVEKFKGILARQMSDSEKRKYADFIIDSNIGMTPVFLKLKDIVTLLTSEIGRCWPDMYEG